MFGVESGTATWRDREVCVWSMEPGLGAARGQRDRSYTRNLGVTHLVTLHSENHCAVKSVKNYLDTVKHLNATWKHLIHYELISTGTWIFETSVFKDISKMSFWSGYAICHCMRQAILGCNYSVLRFIFHFYEYVRGSKSLRKWESGGWAVRE